MQVKGTGKTGPRSYPGLSDIVHTLVAPPSSYGTSHSPRLFFLLVPFLTLSLSTATASAEALTVCCTHYGPPVVQHPPLGHWDLSQFVSSGSSLWQRLVTQGAVLEGCGAAYMLLKEPGDSDPFLFLFCFLVMRFCSPSCP